MEPPAAHLRDVTVNLENGLHMRPLSQISQLVQRYRCTLRIRNGTRVVDARNMLDLLTLGAEQGTVLSLEADGDEAGPALSAVVRLFETNFEAES